MNKKVTSLLLVFVMLFSMMATAVPAYAAGSNEFVITPDKSEAYPGDTITYTVVLGPIENFQSANFTLVIPDGLTFVSGAIPEGLKELTGATEAGFENSTLTFYHGGLEAYTSNTDTVLMTFTCTVNSNAMGGYQIEIMDDWDFADSNWTTYSDMIINTAASKVTVVQKPVAATGISLNKETLTLKVGESETLIATLTPENVTDTVVWSSSDKNVATVDASGKVTAIAEGNAIITAKAGDVSATCEVTTECAHTNTTEHPANASTCTEQGNNAYTTCDDCGDVISGSTEKLPLDPTNHVDTTTYPAETGSCVEPGHAEYSFCNDCKSIISGNNSPVVGPHGNYVEKAEEKYLKTAADCDDAAVYYKSCELCGKAHATETFTYGEALGHSWTDATCTDPKTCATCGVTEGTTIPHVYDQEVEDAKYLVSEGVYYKSCKCGKAGEETFTVAEQDDKLSGYCGDPNVNGGKNVTWTFDLESGLLTIAGTGAMADGSLVTQEYLGVTGVPWRKYNDEIKTVDIKTGVTTIGDYAIDSCFYLTSINIPEGVTEIGESAFYNCLGLTSITLPDSLTEIGDYAFWGCGSSNVTELSVTVPEGVTKMGKEAFCQSAITSITLPGTLEEIARYTFYRCPRLSDVTISEGISEIGDYAFYYCPELTSIDIPAGTVRIGEYAFGLCSKLSSITLSEGLVEIGKGAFYDCGYYYNNDRIGNLVIPEGVTKIEEIAFRDVPLLSVTLPASVIEIGARAFGGYQDCLTDVYYGGTEAQWKTVAIDDDNDALKNATIHFSEPDKVEFKDVPANAYYHDAVMWAVENGITTGTGDGSTFEPNSSCTRGQVVTFLWRAAGKPEPTITDNPFVDVKSGDYFYKAVLWAKENNITSGTGDGSTFEPNSTCNRAQIVTFLSRAKSGQPTTSNNPFKDVPAGAYYYNPVLWAVENKITTGTGDGTTFEPNSNCTRGQVITFLWRAYTK